MSNHRIDESTYAKQFFAGLLGFCIIATIQLISISELDLALQISLYCFAVAIPCLTAALLADLHSLRLGTSRESTWLAGLSLVGTLAGCGGSLSLLFHFGSIPGTVFAVTSLLAMCAAAAHHLSAQEASDEVAEQDDAGPNKAHSGDARSSRR